ncbi:PLC-like phosphodiesterase [Cystobasidium minutum MCA 4210]|uniref:PLC-like phosphodiesterase n=1 Tax=Cystobasidium minutum MCA 4210 TaxID=1397322 RepID=UPI0034CD582F|eukprot:jgi/Rhomi1/142927/e_gw1.3.559.1
MNRIRSSFTTYTQSSSSNSSATSSEDEDDSSRAASGGNADTATATKKARKLPQCWGHRGASAAYPENTLASFEQAIRDGAEGIESNVHVSLDGQIVMFHDAYLNRTTNGKGLISKQAYIGGIDQLRTTKLPAQSICTFAETLHLLMQPEARHVQLNVDVKLDNDPEILFKLMHEQISKFDEWQTQLAPRLILGLWHAKYIEPAQRLLPYCKLAHIGVSPSIALKYFWNACSAFSLNYATLIGKEGSEFRRLCRENGKELYIWTVNDRKEMIQAIKWGAEVILTDKTADYLNLRGEMTKDWNTVSKEVDRLDAWSNLYYYTPINEIYKAWHTMTLHRSAGPMPKIKKSDSAAQKGAAQASKSDTSV